MIQLNGKVGILLQVIVEVASFILNMDMETILLSVISFLLLPFIVGSMWVLGINIIWQFLRLGIKAGIILFVLSSAYLAYLRRFRFLKVDLRNGIDMLRFGLSGKRRYKGTEALERLRRPKCGCSLMDVVLSIYFQSGLWVPSFIWEFLTDLFLGPVDRSGLDQSPSPAKPTTFRAPPNLAVKVNNTLTMRQRVEAQNLYQITTDEEDESSTDYQESPSNHSAAATARLTGRRTVRVNAHGIVQDDVDDSRGSGYSLSRRRGTPARTRSTRRRTVRVIPVLAPAAESNM